MTIPPVEPAQRFAANMRRLRGTRGYSQEAFALLADIHRTEVTKLESGKRDPKLGTVVKVARGLEVPLTELLEGVGGLDA
jgi:transcriptional regulator with XRE-family HTH domain